MSASVGKVYLVGAGPGDPGLLTLRGAECLRRADLVLYDYLANPKLLDFAPDSAECVCLGRHGQGRLWPTQQIIDHMIEAARSGRTVVRLKGGDPMLFARVAEEIEALTAANIVYEIVPGITAALALASYAGIPLTHRDLSSCVALITGQESETKQAPELNYTSLASFPGTLVFYMGVTSAARWTKSLIDAGKPSDTPVIVVRRCSLPNQQSFQCQLSELHDQIVARGIRPPALIVVGSIVSGLPISNWFTSRPLFGTNVLVTRPVSQAGELMDRLSDLGAQTWHQPAIEIAPPADWTMVDRTIDEIARFDWLVFSSRNGVQFFLDRLMQQGRDLRVLGRTRIAAIGPATAAALCARGLRPDVVPDEYCGESLATAVAPSARGARLLMVRANRGRDVAIEMLSAAGAMVESIAVYVSRDVEAPNPEIALQLSAGKMDWTTVTSPAIARSLVRMFGASLTKSRLAAISPITAEVLCELGYPPAAVATQYTTDGLVEAMLAAIGRGRPA